MSKLVHTKGIILRTTNYSETSIICSIYTEQMGTKGYIVSGVRSNNPKNNKGVFFQAGNMLDLVVYDNEFNNLNRIKEFKWDYLYTQVSFDIFRNAAMLFIVELLSRTLRQPDHNPTLLNFTKDILCAVDKSENSIFANLPIFFMEKLLELLGFKLNLNDTNEYTEQKKLSPPNKALLQSFIDTQSIGALSSIKANKQIRHELFEWLHDYYCTHINDFGKMKSYDIIKQILQ